MRTMISLLRRTARATYVAIGLSGALLSSACGGGSGGASSALPANSALPTSTPSPMIWMVSTGALNLMQQAGGQTIVTQVFDQPYNFIIGQTLPTWASNWTVQQLITETSIAGIRTALQSGLPAYIKGIVYDLEDWPFSPPSEQQNPVASINAAATLVHQAGLALVATPATDLVNVLDPGAIDKYAAYLSLGIPAAAQNADVFEIQAQGSEANTALYASFVTAAAQAARAANPHVIVLAGLSTNPDGQQVTAQELYTDVQATRGVVNGYWLNIPSGGPYCPYCGAPQPQVAIGLLEMLQHNGG